MLEFLPKLIDTVMENVEIGHADKPRLMTDGGSDTSWLLLEQNFYKLDGEWAFVHPDRDLPFKTGDYCTAIDMFAFAARRSWLRKQVGLIYETQRSKERITPLLAQEMLDKLRPAGLYGVFTYETFAAWPNRIAFADESQAILAKLILDGTDL